MITKLAKGGVIEDIIYIFDPTLEAVIPAGQKYYKIYKRTKNRRIKKKNAKKSLKAMIEIECKSFMKNVGISNLMINGEELNVK